MTEYNPQILEIYQWNLINFKNFSKTLKTLIFSLLNFYVIRGDTTQADLKSIIFEKSSPV